MKFFEKKFKTIFLGVLAHFTTFYKKIFVRSGIPLCYHMDESVIPQASQYYFYSRGIIGVIVHGHVINIYIYLYYISRRLFVCVRACVCACLFATSFLALAQMKFAK